MALDPMAEGLFTFVTAVAERIAKGLATAIGTSSPRLHGFILFAVYLVVVCPLLLLAVAGLTAAVGLLVRVLTGAG